MRALLLGSTILPVFTGHAAWGDHGQRIVCEIAFRVAVPEARGEIRPLIPADSEFDFFADACIWPDHPKADGKEELCEPKGMLSAYSFQRTAEHLFR
jgi:hypothetical protein